MTGTVELMVEFHREVSERTAKDIVHALGAQVRRRMRSDHPDQVLLLVSVGGDAADKVIAALGADERVRRTEKNRSDYEAS